MSKSLILFSKPAVVNKHDLSCIKYMKIYGANCFGGRISKPSNGSKCEWVDKNIIDYDNCILLKNAKHKLLFLYFCMEYKRFYEFYIDENASIFHTRLPIQLDATCNGFQHMALLSNEDTLFKELNLVRNNSKDSKPKDFYNFLLHKLTSLFEQNVVNGLLTDNKTSGSYERLYKFIWDRSYIKKTIMTIPYNVSDMSMKKYLKDCLHKKQDSINNRINWYSTCKTFKGTLINDNDISLLIDCLTNIIRGDFEKIKKLIKYLKTLLLYTIF